MDVKMKGGRMYLNELFDLIATTKAPQKKLRIQLLHEYVAKGADHELVLKGFAECTYHPEVVFDLPEGTPPYEESTAPDPTFTGFSLFNFFKSKYVLHYAKNPKMLVNPDKRQSLFVQNLSQLYKDEAKLLIIMKDKDDKPLKYVNEGLFRDAFPTWLPEKK
jgi:hypothetical protein